MKKFIIVILCLVGFSFHGLTQIDTTIGFQLTTIIVTYHPIPGTSVQRFDSIDNAFYRSRNLSDLLQNSGHCYIKQYTPGQLSTISLRGSNASQVQLNWNGFNLNNLALGQTDYSLVPMSVFNNGSIVTGAMGETYGNGAIAGTIYLNTQQNTSLKPIISADLSTSLGSFGRKSINAGFTKSSSKKSFDLHVFSNLNKNNFNYINAEGIELEINHASSEMYGLTFNGMNLLKNGKLEYNGWIQTASREIPTYIHNEFYAQQSDQFVRLSINYKRYYRPWFKESSFGYFYDRLDYRQVYAGLESNLGIHTIIVNSSSDFIGKKNGFHSLKLSQQAAFANNSGYDISPVLLRSSLSYKYSKVSPVLGMRAERSFSFKEETNDKLFSIPIIQTGIALIKRNLVSHAMSFKKSRIREFENDELTLGINAGTVYRFPTLNDLYWSQGGNPLLKSEKGISANANVRYSISSKQMSPSFLSLEFNYYNRYIYDWIIWFPNGRYWSPQNLQEVWSRGTETVLSWRLGNKFNFHGKAVLNYSLSTLEQSQIPNDAALGRQLIYTPMYNYMIRPGFGFGGFNIEWRMNYYGYRYLSSDNYEYLEPFTVHGARLSYLKKFKSIDMSCFAEVDNLFDLQYQWVASQPVLPRNFLFGINIQFKSKIKS